MSQTTSSALNNRVVNFVCIENDFDCVICMQVADNPMRCSGMCAGVFCTGCMQQTLRVKKTCPSCMKSNIIALNDVVLRNLIMKHHVYCINSGAADHASEAKGEELKSADDKCAWTGNYDQLAAHLSQCKFEMVSCKNDGCIEMIEQFKLIDHMQACAHRTENCLLCGEIMKATAITKHVEECPMMEIQCEVIGCNTMMMRRDYEKHQDDAAKQHVCATTISCLSGAERSYQTSAF